MIPTNVTLPVNSTDIRTDYNEIDKELFDLCLQKRITMDNFRVLMNKVQVAKKNGFGIQVIQDDSDSWNRKVTFMVLSADFIID